MAIAWLALWTACTLTRPAPALPVEPAAPVWPEAGAPLRVLAAGALPAARILVDAGHGAEGNAGNVGVNCQREQDVTRRLQDGVVARLAAASPLLAVEATRPGDALVSYDDRIARADAWADVLVSLHTDARAGLDLAIDPATGCRSTTGAAGFSVLWSDEGPVGPARRRWATAIAARLREAGFPAYDGADYIGLYAGDPEHPGVFVDRHVEGQRIKILRRTTTPTVLVETHQALDAAEVARWEEPATLDAFAAALAAAIADVLGAEGREAPAGQPR